MVNIIKKLMKDKKLLPIFLILSLLFVPIGTLSPKASTLNDPLDQWYWRSPLPTGNDLQDVAYGNNMYVIVGDHGTILTSKTKTNWERQDAGTNRDLLGVAFGNGKFVAVGSGVLLSSTDSINWMAGTVRNSQPSSIFIQDVVYGNGKFVAYGYVGNEELATQILVTSTNGEDWTLQVIESKIVGLTYGNNNFVAIGNHERNRNSPIYTSFDGITWIKSSSNLNGEVSSLTFGNGRFVAVGLDGPFYSTNGLIWNASNEWESYALKDIAYGNSVFMATGLEGIVVSTDGINWTKKGVSFGANGVGFGYDTFITVSNKGKIQYSTIGNHWYKINSNKDTMFSNIAFGTNKFVAVASSGEIFTSTDGEGWDKYTPDLLKPLYDVTYGNNKFVAVGNEGVILVSSDGQVWSRKNYDVDYHLYGITYNGNKFVAVGSNGIYLTSTNGLDWSFNQFGNSDDLYAIAYGNNTLVAVGEFGKIYTSANNGFNWNAKQLGTNKSFIDITYGNKGFVAISYPNEIWTSADAVTWKLKTSSQELTRVAYGNNTYIAVGYQGSIVTSYDTIGWTARDSGTSNLLMGVAYGNNTFVSVGEGETIIQSRDVSDLFWERLYVYLNKVRETNGTLKVTLIPSREADIYYTLDGSNPTINSLLYQDSIVFYNGTNTTLKYIAIDQYGYKSQVYTETLIFDRNDPDITTNIGFLPPLNNKENVFKQGSTIPIKFKLADNFMNVNYSQGFKLFISQLDNGRYSNETEVSSVKLKNKDQFKYDEFEKVFHYNLRTKGYQAGEYQLRITYNNSTLGTVNITLR